MARRRVSTYPDAVILAAVRGATSVRAAVVGLDMDRRTLERRARAKWPLEWCALIARGRSREGRTIRWKTKPEEWSAAHLDRLEALNRLALHRTCQEA